MGRPKGGNNRNYTLEYKLSIVKRHIETYETLSDIARDENISRGMVANWCKAYRSNGIDGLKPKKKGNPFNKLFSKSLTKEECLELENLKLRIENERLKKGYQVKGGGANKEYVSIYDKNIKSLKH